MSYTDEDHAAWQARADAVHPHRARFGCRLCDPVPGWTEPEPHGDTGWVKTRWIGPAYLAQEVEGVTSDRVVYRLEFLQPDGRWTGPYCAEHMTAEAFAIRDHLIAEHGEGDVTRPWPDSQLFLANPGEERHVCGTDSVANLARWFGRWFLPLIHEGGHVAAYTVPVDAIALHDEHQIIYRQRLGVNIFRLAIPRDRLELVERIHPTTERVLTERADRRTE